MDKVSPYYFYFFWQKIYSDGLTTRYENQPSGIKNFQLDELISSELIKLPPPELEPQLSSYLEKLFTFQNKLAYGTFLVKDLLKKGFENLYEEYDK